MKTSSLLIASCLGLAAIFAGLDTKALGAKLGLFEQHADVGETPVKGKATYESNGERYTVTGGGANMWLKTDAFHFVYKKISGDLALTADVQFVGEGVEQHRKAALMIRQSLDPDSAYADVAVHGDGLTSLQYRLAKGEDTQEMRSDLKAPMEIRIERHGNQYTVAAGKPGEELKTTGPATIQMQDPVYVGLAVCSHNANVLETAIFSKVRLEQSHQSSNRFPLLALRSDSRGY